ncbi:MAG TPA: aminopeptidase [Nitrospiraceae bacterium]|nr:aminopeptidase [Nitrospiraceae bacterium]
MRTEIQNNLKKTVYVLARDIGSRGYLQTDALNRTIDYITSELRTYGYAVLEQPCEYRGRTYKNIYVEKKGIKDPGEIFVVGAHYDTVTGSPGADDNASAVAGLLELARLLADKPLARTLHFVAFTLEEPPLFRSRKMGSYVYAESLKRAGRDVRGMICLEMIGYFTDTPDSQLFPLPFMRWVYPDKGNFIALVSNLRSRGFLKSVRRGFRKGTDLPAESLTTVFMVPGVDFSDHRSFWKFSYEALMVTDTAFYRNPHYHSGGDVPETLDYERLTEVVMGLKAAIEGVAGE